MKVSADPDYWSILGLEAGSDLIQLKRAFRREARRWHPDLNCNDPVAEEQFKLVNEAYAVLSDSRRRASWESCIKPLDESLDHFSEGFPDFEYYIRIVLGIDSPLTLENEPVRPTTRSWLSEPVLADDNLETELILTPDQALQGTSVEIELGDGTLVEVSTPQLAGDGWRLRLAAVDADGRDRFIRLRVQTAEGLRIDGLQVHYRLELMPPDAVLGCAVDIPTLKGWVTLQVPPRSSSGRLLRLRGRGLELGNQLGDQLVEIVVTIPAELNDAEHALYQRLQELALESSDG